MKRTISTPFRIFIMLGFISLLLGWGCVAVAACKSSNTSNLEAVCVVLATLTAGYTAMLIVCRRLLVSVKVTGKTCTSFLFGRKLCAVDLTTAVFYRKLVWTEGTSPLPREYILLSNRPIKLRYWSRPEGFIQQLVKRYCLKEHVLVPLDAEFKQFFADRLFSSEVATAHEENPLSGKRYDISSSGTFHSFLMLVLLPILFLLGIAVLKPELLFREVRVRWMITPMPAYLVYIPMDAVIEFIWIKIFYRKHENLGLVRFEFDEIIFKPMWKEYRVSWNSISNAGIFHQPADRKLGHEASVCWIYFSTRAIKYQDINAWSRAKKSREEKGVVIQLCKRTYSEILSQIPEKWKPEIEKDFLKFESARTAGLITYDDD